jgi:RHS repeat-associated protein
MKDDEDKAIQTLNPYRFTGREFDTDDLYYYRARYYDPTLGKFITPDPIGFLGGDMNLHRYVGNDPVNFVDYSGFEGLSVTGVLSSVKESICDAVSSLSGFSTPSASNGNGCAAPMGTNGCGIGGSVSTQGTIINAYFAEQAEREISTEPSNYTFKGHNNTHTTNQKKHIAERIYSNIKATNGEKYTTKAAIQEALTKDSYAKGESITFKRFKKEKYSKRINEASIGQKVNLVAVLGGMIDGQNITFKIHEKSPMLTSAGQQLIVLQNGVQVTEVKAVSKSNHAIAEIELRPRKEQKSSSTDTSPSLELWQEKFKYAPNTPEKFDHLWINVSSPSAKNKEMDCLVGEALKVRNKCFDVDKFIEEYKVQFSEQILTQNIINNIKTMLNGAEEFYTKHNEFECKKQNLSYIFATARLETNETFGAVEEAYWISESARIHYYQTMYDPVLGMNQTRKNKAIELGNTQEGDGVRYHGRGFCQITGKTNYSKAGTYLGIDLTNNPNMAKEPKNAIKIILYGMHVGLFTGKKLSDYIIGNIPDYYNARKIINGLDRASDIKGYAIKLEECFKKGMNS